VLFKWLREIWPVIPWEITFMSVDGCLLCCSSIALNMQAVKYLWNVGKLLSDYPVLQPRRQPSLYSPLWEPQILHLYREFDNKLRRKIFRTKREEVKGGYGKLSNQKLLNVYTYYWSNIALAVKSRRLKLSCMGEMRSWCNILVGKTGREEV
jgi:hypothetical protein